MRNRTDNRQPAPRIVGWIGVAVSIAVIVMCILILTGCLQDPCAQHGGTKHVGKVGSVYVYKCYDGTWQ